MDLGLDSLYLVKHILLTIMRLIQILRHLASSTMFVLRKYLACVFQMILILLGCFIDLLQTVLAYDGSTFTTILVLHNLADWLYMIVVVLAFE